MEKAKAPSGKGKREGLMHLFFTSIPFHIQTPRVARTHDTKRFPGWEAQTGVNKGWENRKEMRKRELAQSGLPSQLLTAEARGCLRNVSGCDWGPESEVAGPGGAWVVEDGLHMGPAGTEVVFPPDVVIRGTRHTVAMHGVAITIQWIPPGGNIKEYSARRVQWLKYGTQSICSLCSATIPECELMCTLCYRKRSASASKVP